MIRVVSGWRTFVGILFSALLLGACARGGLGWVLALFALLPWLATLNTARSWLATALNAWAMSIAFVLVAFSWFAYAIADYLGISAVLALLVLVLAAPLLQPQLIAFAMLRRWTQARYAPWLSALTGASAWVACEWLWPKLLGDSLGHGLYPATWLRQFADVAGVAGLSFALIVINEALWLAFKRRRDSVRAWRRPLLAAVAIPVLLAGYGGWRVSMLSNVQVATPLRIGLVQANIVDYDRLRAEIGGYEVVRRVLDAHFALSYPLAKSGKVDALLWSETVYPTTFGRPKSEDGAAFDREIGEFVRMTRVPLVFGSYDADAGGEYNAAAFVDPQSGLLGFYRKTRLFFATEYLPDWMEALGVRRLLPWAGGWKAGSGPRVMPLMLADGRELPVQALICLDDVDPELAIGGARQGAQALLSMSNDSWFTRHPIGARLHLQVAAFRSIETRLPQARVTSNGISAVIDASGRITAQTAMDEQAVLVAELAAGPAPFTLIRAWGDWLGKAAWLFLGALLLWTWRARWRPWLLPPVHQGAVSLPNRVLMLTPAIRRLIVGLQLFARIAVLWMGLAWLLGEAGQDRLFTQLRTFVWLVLLPETLAWLLRLPYRARVETDGARVRLSLRDQVASLPPAAPQAWRLPLPGDGANVHGDAGMVALAGVDPAALPGAASISEPRHASAMRAAHARTLARHRWLDHPLIKFGLFPLLPALPAFRLHQIITFGGSFGEAQVYGWGAWWLALAIWWAGWIVSMVLLAGGLRVLVEAICGVALKLAANRLIEWRVSMESLRRAVYYLGVPGWLLWRLTVG